MQRLLLVVGLMLAPAVLSAQRVNLEELERQLLAKEAEHAAQQRRAAAA